MSFFWLRCTFENLLLSILSFIDFSKKKNKQPKFSLGTRMHFFFKKISTV